MKTNNDTATFFHFAFYKQMMLVCVLVFSYFSAQQTGVIYLQEGTSMSGVDAITVQAATIESSSSRQSLVDDISPIVENSKIATVKKVKKPENVIAEHKNKVSKELKEKVVKVSAIQRLAMALINFSNPISDEKLGDSPLNSKVLFSLPATSQMHFVLANAFYYFVEMPSYKDTSVSCNTVSMVHSRVLYFSLYNRPPPFILLS